MTLDTQTTRRPAPTTASAFGTESGRIVVQWRRGTTAQQTVDAATQKTGAKQRKKIAHSKNPLSVQTANRRTNKQRKRDRELAQQAAAAEARTKRTARITELRYQLAKATTPEARKPILAELSALGG